MIVGRLHKTVVGEIVVDYGGSSVVEVAVAASSVAWTEVGYYVVVGPLDVKGMQEREIWFG